MQLFFEVRRGRRVRGVQITDRDWAFPPGFDVVNKSGWNYYIRTAGGLKEVKSGDWIILEENGNADVIVENEFRGKYAPDT